MARVWQITCWYFHEQRSEEVMRLAGVVSPAWVARRLAVEYAKLVGTIDERARPGPDGELVVGWDPQLVASLVEEQS